MICECRCYNRKDNHGAYHRITGVRFTCMGVVLNPYPFLCALVLAHCEEEVEEEQDI
jgi:hypothetical protein